MKEMSVSERGCSMEVRVYDNYPEHGGKLIRVISDEEVQEQERKKLLATSVFPNINYMKHISKPSKRGPQNV
jgi:hypothetical protein